MDKQVVVYTYNEHISAIKRKMWRVGEMGEGSQKIQTFSFKINKS